MVGGPGCVQVSWIPLPPANVAVHIVCITVVAVAIPVAISVGHVSWWVRLGWPRGVLLRPRRGGEAGDDGSHNGTAGKRQQTMSEAVTLVPVAKENGSIGKRLTLMVLRTVVNPRAGCLCTETVVGDSNEQHQQGWMDDLLASAA